MRYFPNRATRARLGDAEINWRDMPLVDSDKFIDFPLRFIGAIRIEEDHPGKKIFQMYQWKECGMAVGYMAKYTCWRRLDIVGHANLTKAGRLGLEVGEAKGDYHFNEAYQAWVEAGKPVEFEYIW